MSSEPLSVWRPWTRNKVTVGAGFGLLAALCFAVMAISIGKAAPAVSASQIMLLRSIFAISLVVLLDRRAVAGVVQKSSKAGWLRSAFAAISAACFLFNIQDSSPTTAALFQQLTPCFVVLIGWLMATEVLRPQHFVAALLATAGGVFVQSESAASSSLTVGLRGLFGATAGAASLISLRRASVKMSSLEVLLSLTMGQLILSLCLEKTAWTLKLDAAAVWTLVVCVTYFLGNIALAASFRDCSATTATVVAVSSTVWTGILDHVLSQRPVNLSTMFAYGLILAASVLCAIKRGDTASEPVPAVKTGE